MSRPANQASHPAKRMIANAQNSVANPWSIEPREEGVMLVRMHSRLNLPDAVFTFRVGEPQYEYWKRQLEIQEANHAAGD